MLKEALRKSREFLQGRRLAYLQTFNGIPAETVLEDLAKFCRANASTYHPDPRTHAVLEGRREVWLRIQHHLNLDTERLWQLYGGKPTIPTSEETRQ